MFQGKEMIQAVSEITAERRRHIRFKAHDEALVVIPNHSGELYGFLVDISTGGVAFEYIPVNEDFVDAEKLNIFIEGSSFHFEDLPVKSVSDIELEEDDYTPVRMRRRSVRFRDLTDQQMMHLEYLIQNSALESVQPN